MLTQKRRQAVVFDPDGAPGGSWIIRTWEAESEVFDVREGNVSDVAEDEQIAKPSDCGSDAFLLWRSMP